MGVCIFLFLGRKLDLVCVGKRYLSLRYLFFVAGDGAWAVDHFHGGALIDPEALLIEPDHGHQLAEVGVDVHKEVLLLRKRQGVPIGPHILLGQFHSDAYRVVLFVFDDRGSLEGGGDSLVVDGYGKESCGLTLSLLDSPLSFNFL